MISIAAARLVSHSAALVILLGTATACARSPVPARSAAAPLPRVLFPSGGSVTVELAISPESRATGLMFRESLPVGHGMLFFAEEPSPQSFWMKNCRFPIDIVFLDASRGVVSVSAGATPCDVDPCTTYSPTAPALFVLEVNAGVAAAQQLTPGTRLEFENLPLDRLPEAARVALSVPPTPR